MRVAFLVWGDMILSIGLAVSSIIATPICQAVTAVNAARERVLYVSGFALLPGLIWAMSCMMSLVMTGATDVNRDAPLLCMPGVVAAGLVFAWSFIAVKGLGMAATWIRRVQLLAWFSSLGIVCISILTI